MNDLLAWTAAAPFLALGLWGSIFGWMRRVVAFLHRRRETDRSVSGVPIAGPLLFFIGWWISPLAWTWWCVLIVALDVDTVCVLVLSIHVLWRRVRSV